MPFEPLQTDEPVSPADKREKDFDVQMMFGCSQFLIQSVCVYGLGVWPHFLFTEIWALPQLLINLAIGFLPSLGQALLGAKKFGLPSAVGSMGGALAIGIFLFLRLQQIHMPSGLKGAPTPEWPREWVWMIPLVVILIFGIGLFLILPKREWSWSDEKSAPKITENESDN